MEAVLVIGWLAYLFGYCIYLLQKYNHRVLTLGRLAVGFLDVCLWVMVYEADKFSLGLVVVILLAIVVAVLLYGANAQAFPGHPVHALLMTLWHLMAGVLILAIIAESTFGKPPKEKDREKRK